MNKKKIINDPIYGFITIEHDIVYDCILLPEFQRLRRIKQLGLTHLVYPGAQHTRFQHAIGAMHLMQTAVKSLRSKGVTINVEEEKGVLLAILLHDIGHGPFSHSLEHSILTNVHHEDISSTLMHQINKRLDGKLDLAIDIFDNKYNRPFLHQLVSSQLDMDRLDYLRRDSFYTGVSEGTVGIERIIQMLNVKDDQLVVDEKGIYSVEKFLLARRFMYWQVYLHKTSIAADSMLVNILNRAKYLINNGKELWASPYLLFFLKQNFSKEEIRDKELLYNFCNLDDNEILSAIKVWQQSEDTTLSNLSTRLINRDLLKITVMPKEIDSTVIQQRKEDASKIVGIPMDEASYFITTGKLSNKTYSSAGDSLKILMKNSDLRELSEVSELYNLTDSQKPQIKYFITSLK